MNFNSLNTPAFVYDHGELLKSLNIARSHAEATSCKLLYSLKACSIFSVLQIINNEVDGFSCSSLNEVRMARDFQRDPRTIHMITPGIRPDEIDSLGQYCDYVTLNSLSQLDRFSGSLNSQVNIGLRINPRLSFVKDERYNPCRKYSKLGLPLEELVEVQEAAPQRLSNISGLHLHTNCDSTDFSELYETVRYIDSCLAPTLKHIKWINLGGGYLFDEARNIEEFYDAIGLLKEKYQLDVIIEPGASVVRNSGFLVSSVIDLFVRDGKSIAILDTCTNHMPEVFEYQYEPDVIGHTDNGKHNYILSGCSCLAGDVFGEYSFDKPLAIGEKIVFKNVGAYTLVKAHMFNGINLPSIYIKRENGEIRLAKESTYEDYRSRLGEVTNETLRKRNNNTGNEESSKIVSFPGG